MREKRRTEMKLTIVLVAVAMLAGASDLSAQLFDNPRIPISSPVPQAFVGTWDWNMPRQSCGSVVDSFGKLINDGRPWCQWPIDQLEKVMNGRARAWEKVFSSDDAMSPRWTCVAAGLGTVLTEGYLRTFSKRADALVMHFEQSNWTRYIYTDGRKHTAPTDIFYHGDSIGWMEGDTFVVETTNLTFDQDGYDDQAHIPRSHMAKITEHYRIKDIDGDNMELAITVEDPLFLKEPFTYVGALKRTRQTPVGSWDCDPDVAAKELYETFKNPYPDDTTAEKYFGIK
jgi:hypothetical protein